MLWKTMGDLLKIKKDSEHKHPNYNPPLLQELLSGSVIFFTQME